MILNFWLLRVVIVKKNKKNPEYNTTSTNTVTTTATTTTITITITTTTTTTTTTTNSNTNHRLPRGKEADYYCYYFYYYYFNAAITTGIFPDEWKIARVTPIFKSGISSELSNYRPISIIPIIVKVFEKIIYDQLYKFSNDNNLLSNCQSGFRSLHSTLTALIKTTDD